MPKTKLLKAMLMGGTAIVGVSMASHQANAAAITPGAGSTSTITAGDTIDAANVAGAANANIVFNGTAGGDTATSLTITGAGTTNLGGVTVTNAEGGDTANIVVGNGTGATVVIFNGAIVATDTATISNLSGIAVNAGAGGGTTTGNSTLKLFGAADGPTAVTLTGDNTNLATLDIGDGTNAAVFAGSVLLGGNASTKAVLNINAGSSVTGAVDVAKVNATAVTINLAEGSSMTGAVSDTGNATLLTINATGSATIGTGSNAVDVAGTTTKNVVVTDGKTLTLAGTGAVGVSAITLGTANTSGATLKITGAKTVTGTINSDGAGKLGVIDIDANTTLASALGATNALSKVDVAAGVTLIASSTIAATTVNFSGNGTVVAGGAITGAVDNSTGSDGAGTLTLGATFGVTGTIGATNSLLAVGVNTGSGTSAIGGAVKATTTTLTGTGTATFADDITGNVAFGAAATGSVAADKKIVGAITTTSDGQGTLTFGTATTDTTLVSGNIATSSAALLALNLNSGTTAGTTITLGGETNARTVTIAGTQTTAFSDDITAATKVDITGDGTVTIAADKKIVGALDAGSNVGTVTFAATSTNTTLVSGTTGASNAIKVINVAPATGVTATFTGAVAATTINNTGAGTLAMGSTTAGNVNLSGGGAFTAGGNVTGNVDNTSGSDGSGTVNLGSTFNLSGSAGATNSLLALNINTGSGTSAIGGAVKATTTTLTGTGTATFAEDVTGTVAFGAAATAQVAAQKKIVGAVTTSADGQGTLTFATATASNTLASGNIGASGAALLALNLDSGTTAGTTISLGGDIFARTVTIANTQTTAFGGDITAATKVNITGDGTVNIAANKKIVGALDADGNKGTVQFAATTTDTVLVSGTTGASNAIKVINVSPATGVTATFTGAVVATNLNTGGVGTVALTSTMGGNLNFGADGTITAGGAVTGNVDNTSGADNIGEIQTASGVGVSGTIGATNSIRKLKIAGGTSAFGGAIKTGFRVALTGTGGNATFADDVTTPDFNFRGATTATVAASKKIVGAVTTTTDGQGTLVFSTTAANTTLVSGNVGVAGTGALLAVTAGAATGITGTFAGAVNADTFNISNTAADGTIAVGGDITATTGTILTADGVLLLNGAGDQTITGSITQSTGADDAGDISVTNTAGTVTFANAVGATAANGGLGNLTTAASTTTVFSSTVDAENGSLSGTSTFKGAVTLDGTVALGNGSKIILDTGVVQGTTVITAAGNMTDGAAIAIELADNRILADGQSVTVVDAGGGTTDGTYTVLDTALFDYSVTVSDANDTVIVSAAKRNTAAIAASIGVSTEEAAALDSASTALASGDDVALSALNTALVAGGATAKAATQQIAVQTDTLGAGAAASAGTGAAASGTTATRLAMLRTGDQYANASNAMVSGFSTGDSSHALSNSVWVKPFGSDGDQDDVGDIAGFETSTVGIAAGIDTEVSKGMRVGGAVSYAQTDVDGRGAGSSKLDVDSLQVTLYGGYTSNDFYIDGSLGYAENETDSTRGIRFGILDRTAKASYDSNQIMANLGVGMPINLGGAYLTPNAGFNYTIVSTDTYTETGAGNLNLTVAPDDAEMMIGSIGAKLHSKIEHTSYTIIPEVHANARYDFEGDKAKATASFTGGGASFVAEGAEFEQFGYNIGAGLSVTQEQLTLGVSYDLEKKDDFVGHSATVQGRVKF